jgi:hypothetical protein
VTRPFEHPALRHPLDLDGVYEMHSHMLGYILEQPDPPKPFSGKESPGGDPHAAREIKKARKG